MVERFSLRNLIGRGAPIRDRRRHERHTPKPGTKVLIIDDSSTVVFSLKKMLQQGHFDTLEAFDAESGIELAIEHRPSLIFLDIVLPGMNGFKALRVLRRDERTLRTPVIMISGNQQATDQFWVQKIGADDFMNKPFTRAAVFERVERLLFNHKI
jgi:twitching motility two-component system response regulator PilH